MTEQYSRLDFEGAYVFVQRPAHSDADRILLVGSPILQSVTHLRSDSDLLCFSLRDLFPGTQTEKGVSDRSSLLHTNRPLGFLDAGLLHHDCLAEEEELGVVFIVGTETANEYASQ